MSGVIAAKRQLFRIFSVVNAIESMNLSSESRQYDFPMLPPFHRRKRQWVSVKGFETGRLCMLSQIKGITGYQEA